LVRNHIDLHLLDAYKRPCKLLVGASKLMIAQQ
jgi:serine/threonine protein kinase